MIFLNGLPTILGHTLLHVSFINILAIIFEYHYLKKNLNLNFLLTRTITANLASVIVGLIVMHTISDMVPGHITQLGNEYFSLKDRIAMIPSLLGLVTVNIIIEIPFFFSEGIKSQKTIYQVTIANLITNIPLVILYGSLALNRHNI